MVKAWTVSNHNFQNKYNIGHSFVSSKLVPMSKRYNSVQENCVFTPLMIQTKYSSSGNTKRTCLHLSSNTLKTNNSVSEGYYDSMNYDEEENKENERVDNNAAAAADDDDDDDENDSSSNPIINEFSQRLQTSLKKATDSMMKKENSLLKELDKAKCLEDTMKRANLIVSNLYQLPAGTERAIVNDWDNGGEEIEFVLNTEEYNSAQEEADSLFAAARKMKRGSKIVEELLERTKDAIEILEDASIDLQAVLENDDIDEGRLYLLSDRLERTSSKTNFVMEKDNDDTASISSRRNKSKSKQSSTRYQPTFRNFISPNGCKVLVGRNRRDNEAICFQVARGNDLWLHARGCPGAHVLIQNRRGSPQPTDECIQFAANLAAFYSDARTERKAPVTTASPKHIQKPRGAPPGAVKLRHELNTVTGCPEDVAEELKIAREESGVSWDESGSRSLGGKARNKKRTNETTKEIIAKKRAEKLAKRKRNAKVAEENDFW